MPTSLEPTRAPSPEVDALLAPAAPARRGAGALWLQVGLAAALLGASAAERSWRAGRVDRALREGRTSPVRLADLPMTLGPWVGQPRPMDPETVNATGSTDSIFRQYQHKVTGQRLELFVLFGPALDIFHHPPESCYPSAGYAQVGYGRRRVVRAGDGAYPLRELVYAKGEPGRADQQEVYYSWRYSGAWNPDLVPFKDLQRLPGMFKIQVARAVKDAELPLLDQGNPCEAFLAEVLPELERRVRAAAPGPAGRP